MNHHHESTRPAASNGNSRMKFSFKGGTDCWFDVDDYTIHVWASNWNGREIVRVRNGGGERIVSDKRSFRFKTPHEFELNGQAFRLEFQVGFGRVEVRLYRDDVMIDSDQFDNTGIRINPETGRLDWRHAGKQLAVPLLAGLATGAVFGYLLGVVLK